MSEAEARALSEAFLRRAEDSNSALERVGWANAAGLYAIVASLKELMDDRHRQVETYWRDVLR